VRFVSVEGGVSGVSTASSAGFDAPASSDAPAAFAARGAFDAAAELEAPAFLEAVDLAVAARGARGFAGFCFAGAASDAAGSTGADSGAGRLPPRACEPATPPRSADTPVPVPSGVSSS